MLFELLLLLLPAFSLLVELSALLLELPFLLQLYFPLLAELLLLLFGLLPLLRPYPQLPVLHAPMLLELLGLLYFVLLSPEPNYLRHSSLPDPPLLCQQRSVQLPLLLLALPDPLLLS